MEKVVILGAGRQGITAGEFLHNKKTDITFIDINDDNLSLAKREGFKTVKKSMNSKEVIAKEIKRYSLALSALPARLGRIAHLGAIMAKTNMVDVSYSEDDPLELNSMCKKYSITIIPDAGIAPGTSNLLCGQLYKSFDKTETIKIYVGGIPEKNFPPFGYEVTWSPEDLISEYERKAKIRMNFKEMVVEPLMGIEYIKFKGFGALEAFYTDGLRTLSKKLKNVRNLEEKTIRYKGHANKIKFLSQMGYFEKKAGNTNPRDTTIELFKKIKYKNLRDVLLMRVIGEGYINGKKKRIEYSLIDFADNKHSAMERTTGYSLASFSFWLLKNPQKRGSILTPEEIGMNEKHFSEILSLLKENSIKITKKIL